MIPDRKSPLPRSTARLSWFFLSLLIWMWGAGLLTGCGGNGANETILVSVAANLQPVMMELVDLYQAQTGSEVTFNFASSGRLAQQIHEGAPVDVFISANARYVDELMEAGLVQPEDARVIARGRLVVWTAGPQLLTLTDLVRPEVERIAIANPDHAPYGVVAREALMTEGLWEEVQPKLVYGENVLQTFQFAESGDVDAALTSLSQAMMSSGMWTIVPGSLHEPLEQKAAVVNSSKHRAQARRFLDFLTEPEAQAVLEKYGYEIINEGTTP